MSDETITLSSIQYVMGGNLESVRSSLIKSLTMNSIPFFQGDYSQTARLDPADVFQLFSPRWSAVGRIELESVERFFQHLEESRRSSLTINIHPGKRPSQPPMKEHE